MMRCALIEKLWILLVAYTTHQHLLSSLMWKSVFITHDSVDLHSRDFILEFIGRHSTDLYFILESTDKY